MTEDKMVLLIIIAVPIILFVVLGFVFMKGKGAFLIAGYNTMPPEKKEKYDTVALCKFMGKMMFALSFSMILWLLSAAYEIRVLFVLGLTLFIGIVLYAIIYVNTGNRFRKQDG